MIWSVSPFKNEIDVLEIRLGTLEDAVDRFVIAEATVDQRGHPKPLFFPEHVGRFARWFDRIEYVVVDDMPTGEGHERDVARERHQRDALIRGMEGLRDDDVVLISDLDEIPRSDALLEAAADPPQRLLMDLHVYALNWRWLDRGCRIGTIAAVVEGSRARRGICRAALWDPAVVSRPGVAGWHLHNQGGREMIRDKVAGMMDKHEALVPPDFPHDPSIVLTDEWINESIATGRDLFGRPYRNSEWVGLEELPPYVQRNAERFRHLTVPRPANQDEIEGRPRCSCGARYVGRRLAHFDFCALAEVPDTLLCGSGDRHRARTLDV